MKTHQLKQKTNRRGNVKAYFQRLIILMVTIMASMALASCDTLNNGDDPDNNGKGNKLIGHWRFEGLRDLNPIPLADRIYLLSKNYYYDYYFNKDGSFRYVYENYHYSPTLFPTKDTKIVTMTEGNYKDSNGKIHFTNILYQRGQPLESNYPDTSFEFKLDKDEKGEYLLLPAFRYDVPSVDISWGVKFRRVK